MSAVEHIGLPVPQPRQAVGGAGQRGGRGARRAARPAAARPPVDVPLRQAQ